MYGSVRIDGVRRVRAPGDGDPRRWWQIDHRSATQHLDWRVLEDPITSLIYYVYIEAKPTCTVPNGTLYIY